MPCDMESMEDWSAGVEVDVEIDGGEAVVESVRWGGEVKRSRLEFPSER